MNTLDLREYSDNELSTWVMNDEGLYRLRASKDFLDIIAETFLYTDEQLEVMKQDVIDDLLEEDREPSWR